RRAISTALAPTVHGCERGFRAGICGMAARRLPGLGVTPQGLFVQVDPETWTIRDLDAAVVQRERVATTNLRAEGIVRHVVLQHRRFVANQAGGCGQNRGHLECGGEHDRAAPTVRDAAHTRQLSELAYELHLADAAADADIRLDDVETAALECLARGGAALET